MDLTKDQVITVFDDIAERGAWESLYTSDSTTVAQDRIKYNFLARRIAVHKLAAPYLQGHVLDLGCGTGDLAPLIAGRNIAYTGVDLSSKMIERATQNHVHLSQTHRVKFQVGDCETLPFEDGAFDCVLSVALIEYLPDPSKVLNEIARITKDSGYALITVPYRNCLNSQLRARLRPLIHLCLPLYLRIRDHPLIAMKDVKHYNYTEAELDTLVCNRGFKKTAYTYSNFHIIPFGVDHLLPRLYIRLSQWIDQHGKALRYKRFASNYIALYHKCLGG